MPAPNYAKRRFIFDLWGPNSNWSVGGLQALLHLLLKISESVTRLESLLLISQVTTSSLESHNSNYQFHLPASAGQPIDAKYSYFFCCCKRSNRVLGAKAIAPSTFPESLLSTLNSCITSRRQKKKIVHLWMKYDGFVATFFHSAILIEVFLFGLAYWPHTINSHIGSRPYFLCDPDLPNGHQNRKSSRPRTS